MPTDYSKKDAAKDTSSSTKEVSRAWHDARDDAQKSGELPEREANKAAKSDKNSSESKSSKK